MQIKRDEIIKNKGIIDIDNIRLNIYELSELDKIIELIIDSIIKSNKL